MFKKRKLIFVLFLFSCLLLSIPFISANDNITDVDSHISTSNDSTNLINQSNNNDKSNSFNDLQSLIDKSNNGVIRLTKNYTYQEGDNPILIDISIIIDGNNHTLNALNKSSIFIIKSDYVIIRNLNFLNAGCNEYNLTEKYFSYSYDAVIVDDFNVFNDYRNYIVSIPTDQFGSAIYSTANYLEIINCKFENNNASMGGAIYSNGRKLFVDNVDFINNYAYCGAAIYLNSTNATIFNSRFLNNSASSFGSGIYQNKNQVSIVNSTFFNNHAENYSTFFLLGYWEFLNINLTYYKSFINFNYLSRPFFCIENIYNDTYELMIKFINPSYYDKIENKSFCLKINDEIYNLTVNDNKFSIVRFNSTVNNCSLVLFNPFTNKNYKASITLCNNSFYSLQKLIDSNCEINLTKDYQFYDGEMWIEINKPIIINGNGHIINGMGKSRIFNILSDNVVINNLTFINAYFVSNPYDIFHLDFQPFSVDGASDPNKVYYNSGKFVDARDDGFLFSYAGGAISCNASNLKVVNSTFINNYAQAGGAICVSGHDIQLINLTFINNTANLAGAIANYGETQLLNSYFNLNNAKYSANIYSWGNINIQNTTFDNSSWSVSFKGTWQIDEMNSSYFESFLKFAVIYDFNFNLHHIHDDYYKLKITFKQFPHTYTDPDLFVNKTFCLNIDGNVYNLKTDKNAQVEFDLKLSDGEHSIEIYNPITKMSIKKSFNLLDGDIVKDKNVSDSTSKSKLSKFSLLLKSVKVKKSAKKLLLKVVLKKGKKVLGGKKVIFTFNGKKYTAKTNKKGIAKVTIKKSVLKKLKVGKKVKYKASYGKVIVVKNAKVKK